MKKSLGLVIVFLILATVCSGLPYCFYQLLKFVVTGIFAYQFYIDYKDKKFNFINVIILILYNPIFPIYFKKDYWIIINVLTLIYSVTLLFLLFRREKKIIAELGETVNIIENIMEKCYEHNGIISYKPDIFKQMALLANKLFIKYDIETDPKFKLEENCQDKFICSHIFSKPVGGYKVGDGFVDYDSDYIDELSMLSLCEHLDYSIYCIVSFITDERTTRVDMDVFNQYILPQFCKAVGQDLPYLK